MRHAGADDPAIQGLKDYMSAQMMGVDKWGVSKPAAPEDPGLDPLSADEVVDMARKHLAKLRDLETNQPDNWKDIGEEAWWVLRCHQAWSRKPEAMQNNSEEKDPVAGLTMPSLSYDTNLLSMQAAKRPDLKLSHTDALRTANLVMPAAPPSQELENFEVSEGQTKKKPRQPSDEDIYDLDTDNPYDEPATPGAPTSPQSRTTPASKSPSKSGNSSTKADPQGEQKFEEDKITPSPAMPEPALDIDLGQQGGKKPDTAIVLRGEFKKQIEIKYERQLGYLKVKKAVVELNGKIDFKGEGEKEIIFGGYGALSGQPGALSNSAGDKFEGTIIKGEKKEIGASGKVTGGLELGDKSSTKEGEPTKRGMAAKLFLGTQVKWGPVAHELKLVIAGIDETKSGTDMWTILGVEWSPVVIQGDFELPVSDGTNVRFTGMIKLTIEAEPDWKKIGARLAQALGRQVAVEAGAITAGGAAAGAGAAEVIPTGVGGAAVGELVIAGGFAAIAAAQVYAFYKSAEEIEDLKELQRGADQGVDNFCGGYLAHLGINGGGTKGGPLWSKGEEHAEINLKGRLKRAAHFLNEKYQPKKPFNEDDKDLREVVLEGVKRDAESWRTAVRLTYETAIRTAFYNAWYNRVQRDHDIPYARARVGLASVEPADEPDYNWVNAVGARAAAGMRLPPHRR
jgi:hypothetical protein